MEKLAAIVPVLQGWLDQWVGFLSRLPAEFTLALLLIPIALAIVSKRGAVAIGCIILVLVAYLVFISPSNTAVIVATGFYIGSLVMAVSAIVAQRKSKSLRAEVAVLQSQVSDLAAAEQRRLLRDIRSRTKEGGGNIPNMDSKRPAE